MKIEELEALSHQHPIILYDGICILCERLIQDIITADKNEILRYHSLQSVKNQNLNTVILLVNGERFYKSDVILELNNRISFNKYVWIKYLPKFVRDLGYSLVAKFRYLIFGKKKECLIPSSFPEHLFLDQLKL